MRYKFLIDGVVQGVGFRPAVFKIAKSLGLKGRVFNSGEGVVVEVEGDKKDEFINELKNNLPPLAKIENIKLEKLPLKNYSDFEIISSKYSTKTTFISPDISVCDDCLKEMFDKSNRRYLYPFINCTNCGPRYTIIKSIPYDRKNTSMSKFEMCEECQKEYNNPLDRRYHAQPISCFNCGPTLNLKWKMEDGKWEELPNSQVPSSEFEVIGKFLKKGKIGAIKGLGGFHLICDATNEKAVKELRDRKRRPLKPFAMMFKNIEEIKKYCKIDEFEEKAILSKEKPIVVVNKKAELTGIAENIDRYGVFLPYTPIHYLLFEEIDFPIVATSANISNEPIIRDCKELEEKLGEVVDFILDYNREIVNGCDDSVVSCVEDKILTYRLARGFAPKSFSIGKKLIPKILAVGANQKNTISLAFDNRVILSPHIGDLGTVESVEYFERTIETFRKFYNFKEDIILCDKHPLYETTKWAKNQGKEIFEIQHHKAHIASAMFEFKLDKAIAFSFDGTGYGDDGKIWGGEVFLVEGGSFERLYSFKEFELIGGEKGIKNPANSAVKLLSNIDEELAKSFKNYNLVKNLKNFPLTTSVGRIFDIVAFLGGFIKKNEYEGYSGMIIEKYFSNGKWQMVNGKFWRIEDDKIDIDDLIRFVAKNRGDLELVSNIFLKTLADIVVSISEKFDFPIVLSGGVFQNRTLVSLILKESKKRVYFNQSTPINDGGISLGQISYFLQSNFLEG